MQVSGRAGRVAFVDSFEQIYSGLVSCCRFCLSSHEKSIKDGYHNWYFCVGFILLLFANFCLSGQTYFNFFCGDEINIHFLNSRMHQKPNQQSYRRIICAISFTDLSSISGKSDVQLTSTKNVCLLARWRVIPVIRTSQMLLNEIRSTGRRNSSTNSHPVMLRGTTSTSCWSRKLPFCL